MSVSFVTLYLEMSFLQVSVTNSVLGFGKTNHYQQADGNGDLVPGFKLRQINDAFMSDYLE